MKINQSRRNSVKQLITLVAIAPALGLFSEIATAAKAPVYTGRFNNLALGGHDAVAYFKQSEAVKGDSANSLDHKGARWLFSSKENMEQFKVNPDAFAPQFGGYCAFSISKGKIVKGDPKLWDIEDGNLYVNFNKGIHRLWLKRKHLHIAKARENWPAILG